MKDEFNDIFDTINLLHKKYSSYEYLENIENFKKDSQELVKILEKYKVITKKSVKAEHQKSRKKFKLSKNNKTKLLKRESNFEKIEAM